MAVLGRMEVFLVRTYDNIIPRFETLEQRLLLNVAPTLSTVALLNGMQEDTPVTISYSDLLAAANPSDPDGDVLSFLIESVSSGTLTKDGQPVTTGQTLPVSGIPIPVGSSSLISTLHYSDSFTLTEHGGNPGRLANVFPVGSPGVDLEGIYSKYPAQSWADRSWTFTDDSNIISGSTVYPGTSGAGSSTGIIQRDKRAGDWGIDYGLRSDFVVQADFIQTTDRIDISIGVAAGDFFGAETLGICIRTSNHPYYPEIGIFNNAIGEQDTGLTSGIASAGTWHNYAVRFNLDQRELSVYVDEVLRGVIDLDTVAGGLFSGFVPSNAAVNIGYAGGDREWADNFQVGAVIPEPVTLSILLLGSVVFLRRPGKK